MSEKAYTLTVEYEESSIGSEVISATGSDEDGLTRTQADLARFIRYLAEIGVKVDPKGFGAKVKSIVAV